MRTDALSRELVAGTGAATDELPEGLSGAVLMARPPAVVGRRRLLVGRCQYAAPQPHTLILLVDRKLADIADAAAVTDLVVEGADVPGADHQLDTVDPHSLPGGAPRRPPGRR